MNEQTYERKSENDIPVRINAGGIIMSLTDIKQYTFHFSSVVYIALAETGMSCYCFFQLSENTPSLPVGKVCKLECKVIGNFTSVSTSIFICSTLDLFIEY